MNMRFFADLSVRKKVMLSFGIVLSVTMILGFFSMRQLAQVNDAADQIRSTWLPATEVLGEIKFVTMRYRQIEAAHVLHATAEKKANEAATLQQLVGEVDKLFATYRSLVTTNDMRQRSDAIAGEWRQYLGLSKELIAMSIKGDTADAVRSYTGDMRAGFNKYFADLQSVIDATVAGGKHAAETGAATYASARLWIGGLVILAALVCMISGFVIVSGVSAPINMMAQTMKRLAARDWTVAIPGVGRRDEVGAMADAVQVFKDGMVEGERLRTEQQAEQQRQLERGKKIEARVSGFEKAIGVVVNAVAGASGELRATAQSMSAASEETSRQSTAVAAASEEASQNVETVSTATEQLSASIKEIAQQVSNSTQMIADAVAKASRTNDEVQNLSSSAEKIGNVVKLISDIAGQTNLLALNATIEAARAGDAGKGFAVVASEVKSLATQTAKATEEIAAQISGVQEATQGSVQAIQSIADTITKVNDAATRIASAVEEQGSATQEIARNVQQAAKGTSDVSANIANVDQAAQATGAAATQVLSSASELSKNSELLKQQVEEFLREIRAA